MMAAICARCRQIIESRSHAMICTHFNALPTINHYWCTYQPSAYAPSVVLRIKPKSLGFFKVVNVLNIFGGFLFLAWDISNMLTPKDPYEISMPIGLFAGPFMIGIGILLLSKIMKIEKKLPKN